jgi:hypothetical protein
VIHGATSCFDFRNNSESIHRSGRIQRYSPHPV